MSSRCRVGGVRRHDLKLRHPLAGTDNSDQHELVQRTETDPRGLCLLFDAAFLQGFSLGKAGPEPTPFTLAVSVAGGPAVEQLFEADATWGQLVAFATASSGIARANLDLYKDTALLSALDDSELLRTMRLKDKDRLLAIDFTAVWHGDLTVRTLTSKEIVLANVSNTALVKDMKARVQDSEGIPVDQQRLIWAGRQMDDDKTLMEYHVRANGVVSLILRLRAE